MRAEEFDEVQSKFITIHIGIELIMIFYFAMQFADEKLGNHVWVVCLTVLFTGFDIMAKRFKAWKHRIILSMFCGLELVVYTGIFIFSSDIFVLVLSFPMVMILMVSLILRFDFSDIYLRGLAVALTAFPAFVFVIARLITMKNNKEVMLGIFCSLGALVYFVLISVGLISDVLASNEAKLFEQQRLAESTKQANAALQEQQEKVKKANELLGIQKIKLEIANNQIKRVNSEMLLQYSILKYIASSLEVEILMQKIADAVYEGMVLEFCAVIIKANVAENEADISCVKLRGARQSVGGLRQCILAGCLDNYCAGEEVYIDNEVKDGKYDFLNISGIGSLLIAPVFKEQRLIAMLIFGNESMGFFQENKSFFETITAQFKIALNNSQMYSKMQQMAVRDGLTGVYNRGHLNTMFEEYCKTAAAKHEYLTVALFDIDHFKQINDTYGHLSGDMVIKTIARLAKASAALHGGIVARYGGEEFVIVFPNKKLSDCHSIVESLRQRIRETNVECNGTYVNVRVSVGLTNYPETSATPFELLNNADWAMYYSKQNGRDQVTVDSEEVRRQVKGAAGA